MKIKIGQYQIRDWVLSDSTALVKYANNSKIAANLRDRFPHPYTFSDAESFLSQVLMNEPRTVFAITAKKEAIGCIGLEIGDDVHRLTAELGYWLAEPYWGQRDHYISCNCYHKLWF